jgi:hypothetical protein
MGFEVELFDLNIDDVVPDRAPRPRAKKKRKAQLIGKQRPMHQCQDQEPEADCSEHNETLEGEAAPIERGVNATQPFGVPVECTLDRCAQHVLYNDSREQLVRLTPQGEWCMPEQSAPEGVAAGSEITILALPWEWTDPVSEDRHHLPGGVCRVRIVTLDQYRRLATAANHVHLGVMDNGGRLVWRRDPARAVPPQETPGPGPDGVMRMQRRRQPRRVKREESDGESAVVVSEAEEEAVVATPDRDGLSSGPPTPERFPMTPLPGTPTQEMRELEQALGGLRISSLAKHVMPRLAEGLKHVGVTEVEDADHAKALCATVQAGPFKVLFQDQAEAYGVTIRAFRSWRLNKKPEADEEARLLAHDVVSDKVMSTMNVALEEALVAEVIGNGEGENPEEDEPGPALEQQRPSHLVTSGAQRRTTTARYNEGGEIDFEALDLPFVTPPKAATGQHTVLANGGKLEVTADTGADAVSISRKAATRLLRGKMNTFTDLAQYKHAQEFTGFSGAHRIRVKVEGVLHLTVQDRNGVEHRLPPFRARIMDQTDDVLLPYDVCELLKIQGEDDILWIDGHAIPKLTSSTGVRHQVLGGRVRRMRGIVVVQVEETVKESIDSGHLKVRAEPVTEGLGDSHILSTPFETDGPCWAAGPNIVPGLVQADGDFVVKVGGLN